MLCHRSKLLLYIGFLAILMLPSSAVLAKSKAIAILEAKAAIIYEKSISKYLEKYLTPSAFDVDVKVKFKDSYLKTRKFKFADRFHRGKSGLSHSKRFISGFQLTLYFMDSVDSKTRDTLKNLVARKLTKYGVKPKITVKEMFLKRLDDSPESNRLRKELANAKSQITTNNVKEAMLSKKISELKEKSKTLVEDLKKKHQLEIASLEDEMKEESNNLVNRYLEITPLGTLIIVAIIIFGFFIMRFAANNRKASDALADSIATIADSISGISQSISEVQSRKEKMRKQAAKTSLKSSTAKASNSAEFNAKRIKELREVIVSALNEIGEAKILEYLTKLIIHEDNLEQAFLTIELLGENLAFELHSKLSGFARRKLSKFIEAGSLIENKADKSVEIGENLITFLMSANLGKDLDKRNSDISNFLLNVEPDELLQLLEKLEKDYLPRILFHLSSSDISRFCNKQFQDSEQSFQDCMAILAKMPIDGSDPKNDSELIASLQREVGVSDGAPMKMYLDSYVQIIDNMSEDAKSKAVELMSLDNPELKPFLDSRIVTFDTFFNLPEEEFGACMQDLKNEDIAILLASLDEDKKTKLRDFIPAAQLDIISEDMLTMEKKSEKQRAKILARAKLKVIDRMKALMEIDAADQSQPNAG